MEFGPDYRSTLVMCNHSSPRKSRRTRELTARAHEPSIRQAHRRELSQVPLVDEMTDDAEAAESEGEPVKCGKQNLDSDDCVDEVGYNPLAHDRVLFNELREVI